MDAERVTASGLEGSLAPPWKGWSVNILPVRSTVSHSETDSVGFRRSTDTILRWEIDTVYWPVC